MNERNEGMTDKQYFGLLKDIIADLERIKAMGVSDEAEKEIDACIERHKSKMA